MSLPTKRSGGATSIPMKKSKSNDHDDDAVLDHSSLSLHHDLKPNPSSAGANSMAANLSRKKATPPQPAKKFLIKFTKGCLLLIKGFCLIFSDYFI
jgi:cullin-4